MKFEDFLTKLFLSVVWYVVGFFLTITGLFIIPKLSGEFIRLNYALALLVFSIFSTYKILEIWIPSLSSKEKKETSQ